MSIQLNTLNVASNIHCHASVLRTVGMIQGRSIPADDPLELEVVVQQERRRHPQHQLEERGDEGVDERVLEGPQEDGVVQVDAEVLEPDEVAGRPTLSVTGRGRARTDRR